MIAHWRFGTQNSFSLKGGLGVLLRAERDNIRESTLEGLDAAARKAKHGSRPPVITDDMLHTVLHRQANGESVEQIQPDQIIPTRRKGQAPSVASIYRALAEHEKKGRTRRPSRQRTPTPPPSTRAATAPRSYSALHDGWRQLYENTAGMVRGNRTVFQATAATDRWGTTHYGRLSGLLAAPATTAAALAPFAGAALAAWRLPTPLLPPDHHLRSRPHRTVDSNRCRTPPIPTALTTAVSPAGTDEPAFVPGSNPATTRGFSGWGRQESANSRAS